jgi:hypothetical protein
MATEHGDKLESVPRGPRAKYPWTEWMNGNWWTVKQDEDFAISAANFRTSLYVKARAHNMTVSTTIEGDTVIFQFTPEDK